MLRTLGAALEPQERGVRIGFCHDPGTEGRAEQHIRQHCTRPTGRVDGRNLERSVPVPTKREHDGQPDRQVCGG